MPKQYLKVPNLRFRYTGDWYINSLDEICDFYKGNGLSKSDLSDDGEPCILYGELYTTYKKEIIESVVSKTNIELSNPFKSQKNDVIIPGSGEDPIDIAVARAIEHNGILLGGDLNVLRPHSNYSGAFMSYQLNGRRRFEIAKKAQGKSIVHLHNSDLKEIKVYMPQYDEQIKVTEFLKLIDQRIELQNKIIEDLVYQKNQIRKKIVNKLLIKSEVRLCNLCSIVTGKKDANQMRENGQYKFFTCSKDDYYIDTYSFEGESLIISGNGEIGLIKFYSGKFDAYQRTYVLQNFLCDPIFLKSVLEEKLPRVVNKEKNIGAMPYITIGTLNNILIPLPNDNAQLKVKEIIQKLELRIKNESQILIDFEIQKKYLLNNLFI